MACAGPESRLYPNPEALPFPPLAGADSAVVCNHHGLGGAGAAHLATAVVEACNKPSEFKFLYDPNLPIKVWISVDKCG